MNNNHEYTWFNNVGSRISPVLEHRGIDIACSLSPINL